MEPLVLASASPRRRELIERLGLPVVVDPVPDAEPAPAPGEAPLAYVARAARAKGAAALERARARGDSRVHVAADTVVIADGLALGKPADRAEARAMLGRLLGREHEVATALVVGRPGGAQVEEVVRTTLVMRELRPGELEGYLDSGEWVDKAGAYAVQGLASFFVREVRGSYTNVVGLPTCELVEALWRVGALTDFPPRPAGAR